MPADTLYNVILVYNWFTGHEELTKALRSWCKQEKSEKACLFQGRGGA